MSSDFLSRIILERNYKISLLRETLELGNLDKESLFHYLNEITKLQYRFIGHSRIMSLTENSTAEESLESKIQSFSVLENSISFIDGIVAALGSASVNRHLLAPYHGKSQETSVREELIDRGQNEILETYGLRPPN